MNRNYIIGICILVIIAMVGISCYFLGANTAKETQIEILGNETVEEGGSLHVQLLTSNASGIEGEKLKVVVKNKTGKKVLSNSLKTNKNGKISVDLENLSCGKYTVNVTFEGDKNYFANYTSKKIKIVEKKVVEETPEPVQTTQTAETSQSSQDYDIDDMDGDGQVDVFYSEGYYDDVGMVQYYNTRGGEHLEVYDDGSYYYMGADGSDEVGYL